MKKNKKVKVNDFLWWKRIGNSSNQNIDCVCKVTYVSETGFIAQRLDNFTSTRFMQFKSDEFQDEMSPCTITEAKKRSREIFTLLKERSRVAEVEAKSTKKALTSFKQDIKKIFPDL